MSIKQTLQDAQKEAMKAKDSESLSTIRQVLSAIKNEEISSGGELKDEQIQTVIARQVKQLKDALKDFEAAGRDDLAGQNKKEIALLEGYLPAQLSDEELETIVKETIAQTGATGPQDLGKVMGAVMGKVKGQADGNRVREMATKLFTTN